MNNDNQKCNGEKMYEATRYDSRELTITTTAPDEARAIDPKQFDLVISSCDGTLGFRESSGQWTEYQGHWPRVGPVTLRVLQALMVNPGDFLTPVEVAELTGFDSLRENETLAARVCALRASLHDKEQRFIQTRQSGGYAIRWHPDRTFLTVDIAKPASPLRKHALEANH